MPRLTILCFKKLKKVKYPNFDNENDNEKQPIKKTAEEKQIEKYIDLDFSLKSEFDDFFSNFLNEIGKILTMIAKYRPMIGIDFILSLELKNEFISIISQFLSFYIRSIEIDSFNDQILCQKLNILVQKVIDLPVGNPTQFRMKLDVFISLLPYFHHNFDVCIYVFQYVRFFSFLFMDLIIFLLIFF